MRTLPAAVQECVLGSGALGLLKGEAKQLGNGRSLLEKSELFMMACSACNHSEVPLQLGKRGSGRFGVWKLVCSGCQAVDETWWCAASCPQRPQWTSTWWQWACRQCLVS